MLTPNLERTLHRALAHANERHHEYATAEHLLLSLTEDEDAIPVFLACNVDLLRLRREILIYVDNELASLVAANSNDAKPTASFQRVLQRSAIHVQASGRDEVTGANVPVAMFAERESHAVFFLQEQELTRFDAVNFIVHGISKTSSLSSRADGSWNKGRAFKCAIKGDLVGSQGLIQQFPAYLSSAMKKIQAEVEYASLESGDSVLFVDSSADRVLSAARSIQAAVSNFQVPQSFRFGAALASVQLVLRVAARLEPYAIPGTVLCTEEFFFELDPSMRSSFISFSATPDLIGLTLREDGRIIINKNAEDEPIVVRLYQANL